MHRGLRATRIFGQDEHPLTEIVIVVSFKLRCRFGLLVAGCVSAVLATNASAQSVVDFRETARLAENALMRVIAEPGQHLKHGPKGQVVQGDQMPWPQTQVDVRRFPRRPEANENVSAAFAIDENLLVAYIGQPIATVTVLANDGKELDGKVVVFDYVTRLAAIRVEDASFMPLVISVAPTEPGMPVAAICKDDRTVRVSVGTVATRPIPSGSGVGPTPEINFDRATHLVGTPVLDSSGIVVGVMVPSLSGGLVCARASDVMRLSNAATDDDVTLLKRGLVGIQFEAGGALVLEVSPGSAAEQAGIKAGDLIEAVGNQQVRNSTDVIAAVEGTRAGDSIEVSVIRDGESQILPVVLQDHPQQLLAASEEQSGEDRRVFGLRNGRFVPINPNNVFPQDLPDLERIDPFFRRFDVPERRLQPRKPDEMLQELRREMDRLNRQLIPNQ